MIQNYRLKMLVCWQFKSKGACMLPEKLRSLSSVTNNELPIKNNLKSLRLGPYQNTFFIHIASNQIDMPL